MNDLEITNKNVHNKFKLNGDHFTASDLSRVGYSYVKEGDDFEQSIGEFLLDWLDNKPYVSIMTSGTTGAPKEIRLSKKAMIASALATGNFFELEPGNKALLCLSSDFIAGKMMLVRSLILGLELDIVLPSSKPLHNNTTVYDFVAMVPLQVENSLDELKNVKKLIIGGAAMSPELIEKTKGLKIKIFETYGMTETITHIAARALSETYFTVLQHATIKADERGCMVISAPSISDEVIVTNDLVEITNGNQFVFLGRIDNIINSGGVKLIPEVIEAKLSGKIDARFFVAGVSDVTLGEKLILIIEGNKQIIDPTIFDGLDKYHKPKEIRFVCKFIETESGKLKRSETVLAAT